MTAMRRPLYSWWGYLHVNGSLHVKRYFGPEDLAEARQSPFVSAVFGPWECRDRDHALAMLNAELGPDARERQDLADPGR